MTRVLGVSALYHDAAACLVEDGVVVAAAEEERFTRRKHDASLPVRAIEYCLAEGGDPRAPLDAVVFYEKPVLKLHRLLEMFLHAAPGGGRSFARAIPRYLRSKIWVGAAIRDALSELGVHAPPVSYVEHHEAHAASAFLASPYDEAAILTLDGVGEWATTTIGVGRGASVEILEELHFPHSLGLFYAAITGFCGFEVSSGEYKVMGLAPYGTPRFERRIRESLLDLRADGSFRLHLERFAYLDDLRIGGAGLETLFEGPPRARGAPVTQREMDLARSAQVVLEDCVLGLARRARERTGSRRLCMAGGVALNCVANGRVARAGLFDALWVQPAAGDAGGALGAALLGHHRILGHGRAAPTGDGMNGALLGPEFDDEDVEAWLTSRGIPHTRLSAAEMPEVVARRLAEGAVVGFFQGRMEFGPRALGARSLLADPRRPEMRDRLNQLVKRREEFRPFAPAVLAEDASSIFELEGESPYMLVTAPVRAEHRATFPAITHVDGSARVQTVDDARSPALARVLRAFRALTGAPVLLNTSFNVKDEPIVCTPEDAWRCFESTNIDVLVLGDRLVLERQPSDA